MTRSIRISPTALGFAAILILSCLLYIHALSGMLIWDDHVLVGGQGIGGGEGLFQCFSEPFLGYYYRPLVSASFYLDRLFWRNTPFGFHQTNILLHVLTTGVLIGLLLSTFRRWSVALAGGLLFAVQPAQVSTVAWIGGRTDSLCTLWMALFAWSLILAAQAPGRKRRGYLVGALAAYTAALFTKEQMLAALPLVPLAFHLFCPKEMNAQEAARSSEDRWKAWLYLIPFLGVSLFFAVMWIFLGPPRPAILPQSLVDLLMQGGRTLTYYTLLLLLPSPRWMHTLSLDMLEQAGIWTVLPGYVILVLCIVLFLRWRRTAPQAAWFLAFIFLTLLPVSNFIPMPSLLVAPYRAGVAGLGVAALLAWWVGGAVGVRNSISSPSLFPSPLRWGLAALFFLWCAGLTVWGTAQWRDEISIFSTIVRYDPHSMIARLNLTSALLQKHRTQEAVRHLEALLNTVYGSSVWRDPQRALKEAANNPDIIKRLRGNQGNRIAPKNWLAALFAQLGFARLELEEDGRAEQVFEIALALNRQSAEANLGLGTCAYFQADYPRAERYLRVALAIQPSNMETCVKLGKTLAALGRWREARDLFAKCVKGQPWGGHAYIELATAQFRLGDIEGAIATLEKALRISPGHLEARRMLTELRQARPRHPGNDHAIQGPFARR